MSDLVARGDRDFVFEYVRQAPLALALERALECRLLSRFVLPRPVLDLGCGDGCFAATLYGDDADIDFGVDLDPAETARAQARGVYRAVMTASATALPLPDECVSSVFSNSTLEHIPDLAGVLKEAFRVLRPGGQLFITVPTDLFDRYSVVFRLLSTFGLHSAAERYRRAYDRFWKHYHFYTPDGWRELLDRNGFSVVETIEYDDAARCALHDSVVPLALPAFLIRRATGRYALVPALRSAVMRVLRPLLPPDRLVELPRGTGGLVFLRASRP